MQSYRIAIVGYGIAGAAAAIALRREGHEISHFEARAHTPVGGGLLLQPVTLKALAKLGLLDAVVQCGARVNSSIALDDRAHPLLTLSYSEQQYAIGIRRAELMRVLSEHDSGSNCLIRDHRIVGVDAARGELHSAHGEMFGPFDLVLAADGWNSAIRRALASELGARLDHSLSSALVCVLHIPGETLGRQLVQKFSGAAHVSYWPVSAEHVAIAVNVPANASTELTVDGFLAHAGAIQPLCQQWFAQQAQAVEILQFRFGDVRVKRIAHQRVVLLGDAAHAMSPMLGLGAGLAIEDALDLAAALRGSRSMQVKLDCYAKARRARTLPIQRSSRVVTPLINAQSVPAQWLRQQLFTLLRQFPTIARWFMTRFN